MSIDYGALLSKLEKGTRYSGTNLEGLWRVDPKVRRLRATALVKKGALLTSGNTVNIRYYLPEKKKLNPPLGSYPNDPLVQHPQTTLDELITAATALGTENTLMKKALLDAKATIEKALEIVK